MPAVFDPSLIYMRSTNMNRTKDNAEIILETMFP